MVTPVWRTTHQDCLTPAAAAIMAVITAAMGHIDGIFCILPRSHLPGSGRGSERRGGLGKKHRPEPIGLPYCLARSPSTARSYAAGAGQSIRGPHNHHDHPTGGAPR